MRRLFELFGDDRASHFAKSTRLDEAKGPLVAAQCILRLVNISRGGGQYRLVSADLTTKRGPLTAEGLRSNKGARSLCIPRGNR